MLRNSAAMQTSIIIPALNEAEAIGQCVARAWETGAGEVLVVDGGSQDDTVARAQAAGATVLGGVRGRARQQNLGAGRARGDVLFFLHADCWPEPPLVAQIAAAVSQGKVAGAFRQRIEAPGLAYRLLERGNAFRAAWRGLPYGDQGIWMLAGTFRDLGGFPDVRLMEDVLLMRRLRRLARPALLPGPLHVSARRWQRQGVVRRTLCNWALLTALRLGVHPDRLAGHYGA